MDREKPRYDLMPRLEKRVLRDMVESYICPGKNINYSEKAKELEGIVRADNPNVVRLVNILFEEWGGRLPVVEQKNRDLVKVVFYSLYVGLGEQARLNFPQVKSGISDI